MEEYRVCRTWIIEVPFSCKISIEQPNDNLQGGYLDLKLMYLSQIMIQSGYAFLGNPLRLGSANWFHLVVERWLAEQQCPIKHVLHRYHFLSGASLWDTNYSIQLFVCLDR